ncbi:MAG: hypothetical protein V5A30_07460 [Haloarculaceae archaeon]
MTLDALPERPRVFDGPRDRRFLALAVETLVQDMSLDGDGDVARRLGGYALGEEDPPAEAPEFVTLEGDRVELSNPPFVLGTVDVEGGHPADEGEYRLEAAFDSELNLLIDPPVEVTFEGSFDEVLEALEDTLAQVYRTKGRYLEQVDAGVTDPGTAGE